MAGPSDARRWPITISVMLASTMTTLDMTIANVALPHMQGSLSASQEQVAWVLTSYVIASAIMTPMTGWLTGRFGRKWVFLVSVGGFTLASMLCGLASSLPEIVVFRLLQGMFGATITPLSQAVMLDINPPEKHGQAMAIWGMGTILGPVFGPVLGGWLTDTLTWRWVFFINLPIGLLALSGIWLFVTSPKTDKPKPFDFLGFAALITFIGAFQMMLDRGPSLDWFDSREIWTDLIIAMIAFWVFVIHTLTVRHPFFDRRLLADRNFVVGSTFGFVMGMLLFGLSALLPPMTQGLLGYPALASGVLGMPRGVGSMLAMLIAGRLVGRMDTRLMLIFGLSINALASWQMTHFDLMMGAAPLMFTGFLQGFGVGMMFVPMNTLSFATIPMSLRAEASTVNTLIRNLGSAVGISVMQALLVANTQIVHESLAARINPADPVVRGGLAPQFDPGSLPGLTTLNGEIGRQAAMIAYLDDFKLMLVLCLACIPLTLLLRPPKARSGELPHAVME